MNRTNRNILILVALAAVALYFLYFRKSGYSLSPQAIVTDQVDDGKTIFDLPTDQSCLPGAGPSGDYYQKMDGTGYGICGGQQLIVDSMKYKILNDESPLGQ